jgi:cardiolipin synthase (CMP-forming)
VNAPNVLSLLRIVLIPLFIILLSLDRHIAALVVFVIAAATDGLDGFIARRFKQKTVLGSYLDPIADKMLLVSAFIAFTLLTFIPPWVTILVVSRDVIIAMGIAVLVLNACTIEIRPSLAGKCTTFFQIVTIAAVMLFHVLGVRYTAILDMPGRAAILSTLFLLTAGFTLASGLEYIIRGMRIINAKGMENNARTG